MMNKKNKRLKNFGILIILLLMVTSAYLIYDWHKFWNTPSVVTQVEFNVKLGEGGYQVLKELITAKLLKPSIYPRLWLKFFSNKATFKKGYYQFEGNLSANNILQKLLLGDEKFFQTTIIPGKTYAQTLSQLEGNKNLSQDIQGKTIRSILKLDKLTNSSTSAEGWFSPDTYYFPNGYPLSSLLQQGMKSMRETLAKAWQQRDVGLPLKSAYEMLILASIVEKEAGVRAEKRQIAGVFLQRLEKHMRLQSDPTVIYGLGNAYQGNITKKHLLTDTPYNTYTRFGLPPTPIALPDKDSIMAVSHPVFTDALYFVADGSGGHSFSKTLEEHNAKVRQFLIHKKKKK